MWNEVSELGSSGSQPNICRVDRPAYGRWRYLSTQPDNTPANSDDNTADLYLP